MASKPTSKKAAVKKPAPAVTKKPVVSAKAAKPSKPAPKSPAKPVTKPAPKPAAKAPVKPAPAPVAVKPVAVPAPPPPAAVPVDLPPAKPAAKAAPAAASLTVSVQTSQGAAGNGNTHPANILVIVSCAGVPVVELTKDHFTLMEHFEVPGQTAPFSNNITSFRNAGTGAYLLQTKPITGAPWRSGHHLGQLLISDDDERQGQAGFKLIIR